MTDLFRTTQALSSALGFHRQRHGVLAGNVANVDTPGYRPIDLQRSPAADAVAGASATSTTGFFDDDGATPSADGNTVSLERELAKMDANRVRYAVASRIVDKRLAALRYAASDGNG